MALGKKRSKNNEELEWVTVHGEFIVEEEDLGPTGLELNSSFASIELWLIDMCKNDAPKCNIKQINIGLYEYLDGYTLCLSGVNIYKSGDHTQIKIEFVPQHCYFRIPTAFHTDLERDLVIHKIKDNLSIFSKSEVFLKSFLAKAQVVCFEPLGETIWQSNGNF